MCNIVCKCFVYCYVIKIQIILPLNYIYIKEFKEYSGSIPWIQVNKNEDLDTNKSSKGLL